jgi:hypothetical protein
VSGNTSNAFQINASTGALTVNNSAALNFEVIPSFALIVKVQDNGQGNLSSQGTITVNLTNVNEAPIIHPQNLLVIINANLCVAEHNKQILVGEVIAADPDAGQSITFSIVGGNTNGIFMINPNNGKLYIKKPHKLNMVEYWNYSLTIRVVDNTPELLHDQAIITVTVHITNLNQYTEMVNLTKGGIDGSTAELDIDCKLYPNPANYFFNIEASNMLDEPVTVSILNASGEVVFRHDYEIVDGKMNQQIDVERLSKGIYFVNIKNGYKIKMEKLIKL